MLQVLHAFRVQFFDVVRPIDDVNFSFLSFRGQRELSTVNLSLSVVFS